MVIGRNEGQRLIRCFDALPSGTATVYVDSGSTDRSVEEARQRAIDVVELDLSVPFTAARARNVGAKRLRALHPTLRAVQFVDGDSSLQPGWLEVALAALDRDPSVAVVCGRLREFQPSASIYNRLLDLEWDQPAGEVDACGGIALMRMTAFQEEGGFEARLVAGEEPELCHRLRKRGYRILRIGAEMAVHDGAMIHFRQWWRRMIRNGYAYADLLAKQSELVRRQVYAILGWGVALPLSAVVGGALTHGWGLLLLAAYPAQWARISLKRLPRRDGLALAYGASCVLGRFAETQGFVRYWLDQLRQRPTTIIEHKGPDAPAGS